MEINEHNIQHSCTRTNPVSWLDHDVVDVDLDERGYSPVHMYSVSKRSMTSVPF